MRSGVAGVRESANGGGCTGPVVQSRYPKGFTTGAVQSSETATSVADKYLIGYPCSTKGLGR